MSKSPEFTAAADPSARRAACQPAYREHARSYDRQTGAFGRYRQAVVEALPVRRGQVVLDVGSGTGLCSGLLRDKVHRDRPGAEQVMRVDQGREYRDLVSPA